MNPEVRIQKALADAGVASRRAAEQLVADGRVTVNGLRAEIGQRVDPRRDELLVDGRSIGAGQAPVYLALAKPAGVTSTVSDRHAARTVVQLVPPDMRRGARIYPVGRLDRDSEGLLLLTNDGRWAQRLLHPRHRVEREYAVGLGLPLRPEQEHRLLTGIDLDEGRAVLDALRAASAGELRRLVGLLGSDAARLRWYQAVVRQGWRRQLRRMFAAVEAPVERLVRMRIGSLRLGEMSLGEVRPLSARERRQLDALAISAGGGHGAADADDEADGHRAADEPRGADEHGATGIISHQHRLAARESARHRPAAQESARHRPAAHGRGPVVSLDGPGSSGKSSVGSRAARLLGYRFCDTGVLYRGLTWLALERSVDPSDGATLVRLVDHLQLAPDAEQRYVRLLADGRDVTGLLHTAAVDRHVSQVSRQAEVRAALLPIQRRLADGGRLIMAGRDIGSVVLPEADLKLYLDVSLEERARRRAGERGVAEDDVAVAAIEDELRRRDGIDSTRAVAPLRIPEGAIVIHTEGNTLQQTVDAVVAQVRRAERRLGTESSADQRLLADASAEQRLGADRAE